MAKIILKEDVTPRYLDAARKMLERQGIDRAITKPEDVRSALLATIFNPKPASSLGGEVVRAPGKPIMIFHENSEITIHTPKGSRTYLFIGKDGAGCVEFDSRANQQYLFYADANGSVEFDGEKYTRNLGGEIRTFKVRGEEHVPTGVPASDKLDLMYITAKAALDDRLSELESKTAPMLAFSRIKK